MDVRTHVRDSSFLCSTLDRKLVLGQLWRRYEITIANGRVLEYSGGHD